MNLRFFILLFLINSSVFSQSISKREFRNSEWFATNKDSLFFKTDTIRFIKYSNKLKNKGGVEFYPESGYFDDTESIILKFGKNSYLNYYDKKFHMYSLSLANWRLDKKDSILRIGNDKKIKLILKIIEIKKLKFIIDKEEFETTEILTVKK
jgi:hypothetical protein